MRLACEVHEHADGRVTVTTYRPDPAGVAVVEYELAPAEAAWLLATLHDPVGPIRHAVATGIARAERRRAARP